MGSIVETLEGSEVVQAQIQAMGIANSAQQTIDSNQFVFAANFDGSNNDRNNPHYSNDPQMTNVGQLSTQLEQAGSDHLVSRYYSGPGAPGSLAASSWFNPQVTQQVINKAEDAYNDFSDSASKWLDRNPGGSVTTAITAYSRGDASAAIFSQMLNERGLISPTTGAVLIPPGQVEVSAAVIFDPVTTGVQGNLAFASNVKNVAIIQAENEYRYLFRDTDYSEQANQGIHTFQFKGNHGDIGGVYDNGLGALALSAATAFLQNAGLSIADVPASRQFNSYQVAIHTEGIDSYGNRIWDEYGSIGSTRLHNNVGSVSITNSGYGGWYVDQSSYYDPYVFNQWDTIPNDYAYGNSGYSYGGLSSDYGGQYEYSSNSYTDENGGVVVTGTTIWVPDYDATNDYAGYYEYDGTIDLSIYGYS